jgi:hypothetical protein
MLPLPSLLLTANQNSELLVETHPSLEVSPDPPPPFRRRVSSIRCMLARTRPDLSCFPRGCPYQPCRACFALTAISRLRESSSSRRVSQSGRFHSSR